VKKNRKLYQLTSDQFVLPASTDKTRKTGKLPMLKWPDGEICWPITLYMIQQSNEGKKSEVGGGTPLTYAKQLSHLLRFCYKLKINFIDLDDSYLTQFIEQLGVAKNWDNRGSLRHVRQSNQVLNIGHRTLQFLFWYQATFHEAKGLIGEREDLCQITVYRVRNSHKSVESYSYTHPSFPTKSVRAARIPVSTNQLEQLYIANLESDQSPFIKRRRTAMLNLAKATGLRRVEMSDVTVTEIKEAVQTGYLNIKPAKSRRNKVRQIPILNSQLQPILSYIDGPRAKLIRKVARSGEETSDVLFTTNKGRPISFGTLTNDMHDLVQLAGMEMSVCLQMFRHKYFTDMAYNLLLGIKEFAERRELTAPSERIVLHEMRALSQHENDETLLGYIHAAYKEAKALDSGTKLWKLSQIHESMMLSVQELKTSIQQSNISSIEALERLDTMLTIWKNDLANNE
jgi:hypothetical protein